MAYSGRKQNLGEYSYSLGSILVPPVGLGSVVNVWNPTQLPTQPGYQNRPLWYGIVARLPGAKGPAKDMTCLVKSWDLFIEDNRIQLIVECTNIYIEADPLEILTLLVDNNVVDLICVKQWIFNV
ncbi:hypothetical protein AVEN_248428-1 [Araneus ventricosus]|uniref:Uncharacterized protein n=1 Tax=Araneus ventricosus TaxID=182803 RepID=A0A4Y2VKV0_ARAVE|nr:hypothetical protein AVEN_248428-1 [Araneus ventricosus]